MKLGIIIYTYDRYDLLVSLLNNLNNEIIVGKYEADVYIYDDASPKKQIYDVNDYQYKIKYHRFDKNHGKSRWYQMIDYILKDLKPKSDIMMNYDYYLFTSDDMLLRENFFASSIKLYESIKSPKKICLNVHNDRGQTKCWTNFYPRRYNREIWLTNWVDMCFICTDKLLIELNYGITNFKLPKTGGSGVGEYISRTLYRQKCLLFMVEDSLVLHQASHASKMINNEYRQHNPLISRFKGEFRVTPNQKPWKLKTLPEIYFSPSLPEPESLSGFNKHQGAEITYIPEGIRVRSLQNTLNPGIRKQYQFKPDTKYQISVNGYRRSKCPVVLWISDLDEKIILFNLRNTLKEEYTELLVEYHNEEKTHLYVGMLFLPLPKLSQNLKRDDEFCLCKFNIRQIPEIQIQTQIQAQAQVQVQAQEQEQQRDKQIPEVKHVNTFKKIDNTEKIRALLNKHIGIKHQEILALDAHRAPIRRFMISRKLKQDPIIAGMSTCHGHVNGLREAVNSIISQIDELHLYFNDVKYILPEFQRNPKIRIYQSRDKGNKVLGDDGKFFRLNKLGNCYYFALDDNIIYPFDYVQKMLQKIEYYQRKSIVSVDGKVFRRIPIVNYYSNPNLIEYLDGIIELKNDRWVHIVKTGLSAFHSTIFEKKISMSDFKQENMTDIWFSLYCQELGLPQVVIQHKDDWIQYSKKIPIQLTKSSYHHQEKTKQSSILQAVNYYPWKILTVDLGLPPINFQLNN